MGVATLRNYRGTRGQAGESRRSSATAPGRGPQTVFAAEGAAALPNASGRGKLRGPKAKGDHGARKDCSRRRSPDYLSSQVVRT